MLKVINPDEVAALFDACACTEAEQLVPSDTPEGPVIVEGITGNFAFHPARLISHREQVVEWLMLLPVTFRKNVDGGWSFLNACNQEDGTQWTGLHQRMEQLFCLGMGLGLVECLLPREQWKSLYGGMPYYAINIE